MKQEELKGCPFCGNNVVAPEQDDNIIDGINLKQVKITKSASRAFVYVVCCECYATGPRDRFETPEQAIAAWNRRSPCRCKQTEGLKHE